VKRAGFVSILIVSATLWGCVLSASADTSETIVLAPGHTQGFAVKTTDIGGRAARFHHFDGADTEVPTDSGTSSTALEMLMQKIMKSTPSRIWRAVARCVAPTPLHDADIAPGTIVACTAKACPEGDSACQWTLEGFIVAVGDAHGLSPTPGRCGRHVLTVRSSGEGRTCSLTREISVASA